MQILEIQNGKFKGRRVRVGTEELTVGRDDTCKIRIASEEVSRMHCILTAQDDGVSVRDLDSSNGTFVNGRPVRGQALMQPGALLVVGPMTFKLLGDPQKPDKPTPVKVAKASKDPSVLDDDIASWLAEENETPGKSLSDTTIIQMPAGEPTGNSSHEIPVANFDSSASIPVTPSLRRRDFKTTAEEAQDIISRWQASQSEST